MGLASQVARTALKLPLGRPASCQNADTSGNLGQIIVELVIAAAEPMNDRAGYRSLIKIDMRKWRSVVLAAVIEIDRRLLRQSRAEVCRWFDVFTRPAARTKKRRRDKKYAGKPWVRRRFREGVDQNRSAKRVAYQYRAIIEVGDLFRERRLPHGIAGIRLVRHARVPDIVVGPKFVPQAVDELVVPFIMSPCTSALNEQHLLLHVLILPTLDSARK
ncbi:MAG: hypothetical protein AUH10_00110 [Gammaproteobacteria bacterium 13_2_20CM_66_19]|nr:MAG: hypothetical protein AUH10_00110 [Gammaproteobacteria bacterium 13_2_20CM_66_19]